ncbi:methyltransferase domain-containing protein [Emticicia sp. W12TSBA100-4]|uniref:methyltransferase domain-containing protein n=1 Tax=Emticicia sp. W12TSBA100-4 TaxID=3160965 RepID=UPI0033062049
MNFNTRSYQAELLDNEDIPTEDLYQNLRELDFINRHLGGHSVVLDGIKYFIYLKQNIYSEIKNNPNNPIYSNNTYTSENHINTKQIENTIISEINKFSNISENLFISEIGSGGGDNLRAIGRFLSKKSISHLLGGVDLKEDCVRFAEKFENKDSKIKYEIADYQLSTFPNGKPDVIFNSLFCHHFRDEDLVKMLQWMHKNAKIGFVIADLHRHPLAYYSIKWLTALFSRSYLVKNDAPLSVLRGFTRQEWKILLEKAGIKKYQIKWRWAFRWLILVEK